MRNWAVALILSFVAQQCLAGDMLDMLSGMKKLMTGSDEGFDPVFYERFVACLNKIEEPRLLRSLDAQWKGFGEYAATQGTESDPWLPCDPQMRWFEVNCTTQEYGQLPIIEPCNYASNLAYYHTVTELCDHEGWTFTEDQVKTIAKTFAILGQGSAFFHGSNTTNGGSADVRINDLFAYVAYQAAVSNLGDPSNAIIQDLDYSKREKSGAEWTDVLLDMYIEVPVAEWGEVLDSADFPSIRTGMCGFFATALTIFWPEDVVDQIINILFDSFADMPEDLRQFCLVDFLAEVRRETAHIELSLEEKGRIEGNTVGTVMKLLYAFLWQEQDLITNPIFLDPFVNQIGNALLPFVNDFATSLTTFSYSGPDFNHGINFYPGEEWCNQKIPHAKWHVETGIALADFTFLADEINKIILDHKK